MPGKTPTRRWSSGCCLPGALPTWPWRYVYGGRNAFCLSSRPTSESGYVHWTVYMHRCLNDMRICLGPGADIHPARLGIYSILKDHSSRHLCRPRHPGGPRAMEGISDIRIVGIDETRPPKIGKEPYIDLYFRLAHKAPIDWCQDFNELLSGHPYAPKIRREEGLYIETWVRTIEEIDSQFREIKQAI